jgi:GTP cyclohydrolase I
LIKKDIQSENDQRNISIDKVGVKNIRFPIIVADRTDKIQNTVADIDIFVDLPHNHRGTHMSRFLEVLNSYRKETIIDNLEELLKKIKNKLHSEKAYIMLKFPYFIEKIAPVSKKSSLLDYECVFEATLSDKFEFYISVKVPITTLCPCSKEISEHGAHNQRAFVKLTISSINFIWLEELIDIAEKSASCEIYPLLKRPDEKFVTEKAFNNPAFVEDIVRSITEKLRSDKRITFFSVEAESLESIHNHSAFAQVIEKNEN